MDKSDQVKMILLPIIVSLITLITTLSIFFIEGQGETEGIGMVFILELSVLLFLAIYFLTIISAVPIHFFISKKINNKLISFIVFNGIGLVSIVCIDIWFLTVIELKSLYSVFPLFSILSLVFTTESRK